MADSRELEEIKKLETSFETFKRDNAATMEKVWGAIGGRVEWSKFWAILMFMCTIVGGMFWLVYNKIDSVSEKQDYFFEKQNEKTTSIREDLSSVNTIIKSLNFKVIK